VACSDRIGPRREIRNAIRFDPDGLSRTAGQSLETPTRGAAVTTSIQAAPDDPVLAVRAGLLGRRIVLVPARDVDFIVPRAQRLWLDSPTRIIGTEPTVGDQ